MLTRLRRRLGPAAATGDGVEIRDQLAASRTLLAWVRAALTLMGIAIVVARVERASGDRAAGIGLVLAAVAIVVAAADRLLAVRAELERGALVPGVRTAFVGMLLVTVAGVVLIVVAARIGA